MAVVLVKARIELGEEERKRSLNRDVDEDGPCWETCCFCDAVGEGADRAI